MVMAVGERATRPTLTPRNVDASINYPPQVQALLQESANETIRLFFTQPVADFSESDDHDARRAVAHNFGATKRMCEEDLRTLHPKSAPYGDRQLMWSSTLSNIDNLIAAASAEALRELVAGMTARIHA